MSDVSGPGAPRCPIVVAMSATHTLAARLGARARTGGPKDDDRGPELLEHALGWILVVLVAVLVTRAGLM